MKILRIFALAVCVLASPSIASAAIAIDGSVGAQLASCSCSSTTLTLSTTNASDIIGVAALINNASVSTLSQITSISDTAGLTWTKRVQVSPVDPGAPLTFDDLEFWTAKSSGVLTSDVITLHFGTSNALFSTITAFGISGAQFAGSQFDTNGSLPASNTNTTGTLTLSTTAANTMLLGIHRFSATSQPTAGAGFTAIYNPAGGFALFEYKVVSTAQASTTIAIGTGSSDTHDSLGDAILARANGGVTQGSIF